MERNRPFEKKIIDILTEYKTNTPIRDPTPSPLRILLVLLAEVTLRIRNNSASQKCPDNGWAISSCICFAALAADALSVRGDLTLEKAA